MSCHIFLPKRSLCAICALLKLIGQFCEGFIRPSCKPGFSSNNSDCKIRELFPSVFILLQAILAILGARMLQEFLEYQIWRKQFENYCRMISNFTGFLPYIFATLSDKLCNLSNFFDMRVPSRHCFCLYIKAI